MTGLLNDNTPCCKPTFHPFNRWAAVALDGNPIGYMSHFDGKTTLHLRQDSPQWIRVVRAAGPWDSNLDCMNAIKAAVPQVML